MVKSHSLEKKPQNLKIHHEQYTTVVKDYLWSLRDLSSSLGSAIYYDLQ